ncbi:MAG: FAD:protein FMN transferase, partial [Planctomycetota bacterium]
AREHTGAHLLQLDEFEHTVQLSISPVLVDLGGIGKGYAVDRVAELLRDWSIEIALVSGGYSSVLALDGPADTKGWPLTLSNPGNHKQVLARPCLQGRALSGSGLQKGGHIIDPRTVQPVKGKIAAWASASDAATADALSTAFMIMSPDEIRLRSVERQRAVSVIVFSVICPSQLERFLFLAITRLIVSSSERTLQELRVGDSRLSRSQVQSIGNSLIIYPSFWARIMISISNVNPSVIHSPYKCRPTSPLYILNPHCVSVNSAGIFMS